MTLSCCVQDPAEKGVVGYNRITQEEHHDFYKQWTGDDFPRFLVVEVQHPTPCAPPDNNCALSWSARVRALQCTADAALAAADYDDSYAVNSASQGPWGDAIMHELLPEIESRFRKPIQRCRVTGSAA